MFKFLEQLGFKSLSQLIYDKFGQSIEDHNIYVKLIGQFPEACRQEVPSHKFSFSDILKHYFSANLMSNGSEIFNNNRYFNLSIWDNIYKAIGKQNLIYLLTKCWILKQEKYCLHLIRGNFNDLLSLFFQKFKHKNQKIERSNILLRNLYEIKINKKLLIRKILYRCNKPKLYTFAEKQLVTTFNRFDEINIPKFVRIYLYKEKTTKLTEVKYEVVINFIFAICKKFLKPVFTYKQFPLLKNKIAILIKRNKFEPVTKEMLIYNFPLKSIKLFNRSLKYDREENLIMQKVFSDFIVVIFNEIFVKLIQFTFYVTCVSGKDYKLLYYKKNDWSKFTKPIKSKFVENFDEIKAPKEYGTARIIPKDEGYRITINCANKNTFINESKTSINDKYKCVTPILRNIIKKKYQLSLFGFYDIQTKLSNFLSKNREAKLYIAVFDLYKCFKNIPQAKLASEAEILLKSQLSHTCNEYKAFCFTENAKTFIKKSFKTEQEHFEGIKGRNMFVVKHNLEKTFSNVDLISLIKEGIFNTSVRLGRKFYRITEGLTQGLAISSILCIFYMETIKAKYCTSVEKGILLNYIDDFILITSDPVEIRRFQENFDNIQHEGIILNKKKTSLNFEITYENLYQQNYKKHIDLLQSNHEVKPTTSLKSRIFQYLQSFFSIKKPEKVEKEVPVTWCGYNFYMDGFSVKGNFTKEDFRYSFCVPCNAAGHKIREKILKIMSYKMNPILFNKHNKKTSENIFDVFMYLFRIIRLLFLRSNFINQQFVNKLVNEVVESVKKYVKYKNPELIDEIAKTAAEKMTIYEIKRIRKQFK
ncbi:hypothetical protein NUSPORA_01981 [Nucleospora cyclopteri]